MRQFIPQALRIKYIFIELRMKVNAFIGAPIRDLPDKYLGRLTTLRKHKNFFEAFYIKHGIFNSKTPKIVHGIESEIYFFIFH